MENARILIEVRAGVVPGKADSEMGRRWGITSNEWEEADKEDKALELLLERWAVATAYATKLAIHSALGLAPNWVKSRGCGCRVVST